MMRTIVLQNLILIRSTQTRMALVMAVITVPEIKTQTKLMKTRTSLAISVSREMTMTGTDLLVTRPLISHI